MAGLPKPLKNTVNYFNGSRTYVSESPDRNRLGNTYRKFGPVSVLKSSATEDSKKAAIASRKAKEAEEEQMRKRLRSQ
jgi:hypothetical protein